jgi:hypothetical protein
MRYSRTYIPCNIHSDNNRDHRQRTVCLHIRPEKLQRRLRKGSTIAMLDYDAWVLLVFSLDIPLSRILNFPFSFAKPRMRLRVAY